MSTPSADPNLLRSKLCPYIGFIDDRETALAYPAEHNCCYHAEPVSPVNLEKQREYCLSSRYSACPIYMRETIQKLPLGWSGKKPSRLQTIKPWMMLVAVVIVVGLVLLISILAGAFEKQTTPPAQYTRYPTVTPMLASTEPAIVILPTETATPEPAPTEQPVPPTQIIPHMLETPFRSNPQLLVHQIEQGEGFIVLAERYGTSVDAIKAINYALPETLLFNQIIVIPLNSTDVTNLPPFSAYQEQSGGVTIEELAVRMQIDPLSFRVYNELPEGYVVSQAEWLLIPH